MDLGFIGDILFPPACIACGESIAAGVICGRCLAGIDHYGTLFCGTCMARLPENKKICHAAAPYLLGAAGPYSDGTLAALIHALKFRGIRAAAGPLADILAAYARRIRIDPGGFIVTPLPLSAKRRRSRGFNQAALIARRFAATLGLPFEENLLARIIHRKPQSDTEDIFERLENVRGAFAADVSCDAPRKIAGAKIILVDDVVTSGTTFTEAAKVLKSNGAKKILAFAVAKA
jgi:ComF family protein